MLQRQSGKDLTGGFAAPFVGGGQSRPTVSRFAEIGGT
jgi:hypothetical protein